MTWSPENVETPPVVEFTDEEIVRYATFHFLEVEKGKAHVWRTIGGQCKYLGTTDEMMGPHEPAEQLPLVPSLGCQSYFAAGPAPATGGVLPYQSPESPYYEEES